ncbi:Transmembrane protein 222 [Seminavis robusta]|uniref:Transmembrane protein 222 n=1 Tax=Seminavis robusta TaxID=568900 RepID=A0A9N8HKR3_9STRA|nr:Transmembrane protein 222 [Seminavis robusta]|eukprot:Sro753_g197360.1 Transmembrane protein 222 (173) ;mRNA; f:20743-21528
MMISDAHTRTDNKADLSFCILWSPLHPITLLFPFIGHTGISNSHGVASDFQGPYFIGESQHGRRMAFGAPTRYLKIDIGQLPGGAEKWDECVEEANQVYRGRMHNICCDNCHSHVANALNRMPIKAPLGTWGMVQIATLMFFQGRFVSWWGVILQFGPFLFLVLVFLCIKLL